MDFMESTPEEVDLKVPETSIRAIDDSTIHKICSGQVVLSLAVAVKELVENSLDAGATSVDIRLKNYGMDLIEVSDNGCGVVEDNFAALTLKYHTSKLNEYSDLMGVSSFGFRGEALSSLCALSDLVITTRHKSAECAMKIEYDHKGNIKNKTPCSRQVGTTVSLSNLFASLPVRQKEFHKNAKREFTRMTQLLYAYCLISVGVRITCTNQTKTSPKSVVVATQGSASFRDNIACVFGAKQLQSLLEIRPQAPSIKDNIFKGLNSEKQTIEDSVDIVDVDIDLSEDSNDADSSNINSSPIDHDVSSCSQASTKSQGHKNNQIPFEFQGFISTCVHGNGRSTTDKQFYYVNSRPCEPTKVMKTVNEIYRQFNPHQYPFVFLNLKMQQSGVDINVTPDKRKVFLTKEKVVLDIIKSSLLKLYESVPSTLKMEVPENSKNKQESLQFSADSEQPKVCDSFQEKFASNISKFSNISRNAKEAEKESRIVEVKRKSSTILDFVSKKNCSSRENVYGNITIKSSTETMDFTEDKISDYAMNDLNTNQKDLDCKVETINIECQTSNKSLDEKCMLNDRTEEKEVMFLEYTDNMPKTQIRNVDEVVEKYIVKCKVIPTNNYCSEPTIPTIKKIVTDKENIGKHKRQSVNLKTSIEHVKALTEIFNAQKKKNRPDQIKFKSEINPVFNKNCEEELQREISKDSFTQMEIIGQFNLGFIITRLNDDLFIIDQHATDEIYNFETLQRTTVLTSQKLVVPQQLDLMGVNEQILMDNIPVFTKNGFTFEIDKEAPATKRVKLLTIPMSKNWIFGKDDIEELLFMIRDAPLEHCRPSRVRAMFASRACRKSVMIGTALAKSDMKKLVDHMAEIDKPWNCPHGRPTIRHLVNLAMVHTE